MLPATVARYAKRLTQLYAFVLRSATDTLPAGIECPLSADQRIAAITLVDALQQDIDISFDLQALGMSLFAPSTPTNPNDQFSCPVLRYLAYSHLSLDGKFSHISQIPPSISELQRSIRYVIFKEIILTQDLHEDELG